MKNFIAFRAWSLLCVLMLALACGSLTAAEEVSVAPQPVIQLDNIESRWWRTYLGLSASEKTLWLEALRAGVSDAANELPERDKQQFISLSNELLKATASAKKYDYQAFPEFIVSGTLSLQAWYELFSEKARLEHLIGVFREKSETVKLRTADLGKRVEDLTVRYRKLDPASPKKKRDGANLFIVQLQLLDAHLQEQQLADKIEELRKIALFAREVTSSRPALLMVSEAERRAIAGHLAESERQLNNEAAAGYLSRDHLGVWRIESKGRALIQYANYSKWSVISGFTEALMDKTPVNPGNEDFRSRMREIEDLKQEILLLKRQLVDDFIENPKQLAFFMSNIDAMDARINVAYNLLTANIEFNAFFQRYLAEQSGPLTSAIYFISSNLEVKDFELAKWLNNTMFVINDNPVTLNDLVLVLFILLASFIVSRWIRYLLAKAASRKAIGEHAVYAIARIVQYFLVATVIMASLSILGVDMSKLAIIVGALSVGIGFGLQSIFNNFVSGIILLLERPLKVGDVVELVSGVKGRIKEINVRSTRLLTRDNVDILVPNSAFISSEVINYTYLDPVRRLRIPFSVALGSDKEAVKKAALLVDQNIGISLDIEDFETEVWLVKFGESRLDFELIVWIDTNQVTDVDSVRAAYLWELDTQLSHAGIRIPFPQRDLHIRSVDESLLYAASAEPVRKLWAG